MVEERGRRRRNEFKAILGYVVRPCLKRKKKREREMRDVS
jgi:hypothetical protein